MNVFRTLPLVAFTSVFLFYPGFYSLGVFSPESCYLGWMGQESDGTWSTFTVAYFNSVWGLS